MCTVNQVTSNRGARPHVFLMVLLEMLMPNADTTSSKNAGCCCQCHRDCDLKQAEQRPRVEDGPYCYV